MENTNSSTEEVKSAPETASAPAASAPESVAPAAAPAAMAAPAAAPAPSAPVNMELPKTTGKTPGGWNRFATPKKAENKFKSKDRRDGGFRGR